jgi:tRNA(Ile)-lysidine synthase
LRARESGGSARAVAVAVSGGRDSLALLHAALRAARPLGVRVAALHVHHGLMAEADAWAAAVERQCARWAADGFALTFACTRLRGAPAAGESVEAWARRERYAALAAMAWAAGATLVLLGHHRRDQAETVLLQVMRGGASAGLAAMPAWARRRGLAWARPWLAQGDDAIEAYARAAGLAPVHDPSNADPRFARSRLRASVMPALRAAFPDAEPALAAVARHAQEARALQDEVADADLRRLGADAELPLAAWRALSPARRANALRAWLAGRLGRGAPEALVQRLLTEADERATRRWRPGLPGDDRVLRAWRGRLALVDPPADAAPPAAGGRIALPGPGRYSLAGWDGMLEVAPAAARGLAPARLADVAACARVGGERFQRARGGLARSLKKQYQAAGVPEEGRAGPLLFDAAGALLFAPGLGVDARAWAEEGAPQWELRWLSGAAAGSAR